MLDRADLGNAFNQIIPIPYNRNVFRSVELAALLSVDPMVPLFDLGPRDKGQRYSPINPDGPRALYVSEDPNTAYFEITGMFNSVRALAEQNAPVTVQLNIHAELERVLDLTDVNVRNVLDTTEFELTRSWQWQLAMSLPVPTHILAEEAFDTGKFQAIKFPGAQLTGTANLVIWTDLLTPPSFIEVTDKRFYQRIPPL